MNILWMAPIPLIDDTTSHPAPWIITLAKALVNSGVDLTIVNFNSSIKKDVIKKEFDGISLIYIKTPPAKIELLTLYRTRIKTLRSYLETIIDDYDLLHIHGSEHEYQAMAAGLKIPIVISIQGILFECIKILPVLSSLKTFAFWKLSSIYEKRYLSRLEYYSCRTHWDKSCIESINPTAKIYTIWEMIREDFFSDHFSNKKESILFVGGKNPIKGLNELLQAYNASIQDKGLRLIVLGNCNIDDIKAIINKYNYHEIDINNIECRGMQNASGMIEAYEESFCLVSPTYIDNSPNSVCEAQLSGLPVIATDVGGVASLIEDRKTGLLIGRDSKDIELAVDTLLQDSALRETISWNSRQVARKRHAPDRILRQTLKMYHEIQAESQ